MNKTIIASRLNAAIIVSLVTMLLVGVVML